MSKKNKILFMRVGVSFCIVVVLTLVVVLLVNNMNGVKTGDVIVSSDAEMIGLKCEDTTLLHPVFADVKPISWKNMITANFADDRLSTIMYRYDGIYASNEQVGHARVFAEADYNLILSNEYGQKIDVFSHNFLSNGDVLSLTITGKADKVDSRTAPYFLLDAGNSFPKTLESMKEAYGSRGFSCKTEK